MFRTILLGSIVAMLGALPAAAVPPADQSASTQTARFQSDRLTMRVEGEGRDVILIPGLSSSPRVWDETVAHLGQGWRVHRVHINGFADTEPGGNAEGKVAAPVAEELARYIAEQGLEAPAVVGHSMGGTIAMMLAARHPDAVGRVMVVDQVPFMGAMFAQPGVNPTVAAVTPVADGIRAQMLNGPEEAYRAQAEQAIVGMIRTEARRAPALEDTRSSDRTVSANAFHELVTTDLRTELPRITAPIQVLYVAFDFPGMTPEMTDQIYRMSYMALPTAELTRIDDSAHFIMFDQPERFHTALDAFLAR